MKLRLFTFFIAFTNFLSVEVNAQSQVQAKLDSLKSIVEKSSGSDQVEALFKLFVATVRVDQLEAENIVDRALQKAESVGYVKGQVRSRLIKAGLRVRQRNFEEALAFLKEAEEINKTSEEKFFEADLKGALGNLYASTRELDKALEAYLTLLELSKDTHSKRFRANAMGNIGNIYQMSGKRDKAIEYLSQSIKIYEEDGNEYLAAGSYLNLGIIENDGSNYGQSVAYLKKAADVYRKFGDERSLATSLLNLGSVYINLDKLEEALNCFDEAMPVNVKLKNHSNIGKLLINKGRVRVLQKRPNQAISLIEKGLEEARLARDIEQKVAGHRLLYELNEQRGDSKQALENFKAYTNLKDSMTRAANRIRVESISAEYEFEKKENELKASQESLKSAEKEKALSESRQLMLIIVISLLVLVIVLLVFAYRSYVSRAKLKQGYLSEKALNTELSKESLQKELTLKDNALKDFLERIQQKNELISSIEEKLAILEKEGSINKNEENISELAQSVKRKVIRSITWEEFRLKFDEVHKSFVAELVTLHGDLTNNELDICILLKINLANKEIAQTLNMSYDSVKKSLQRLYRKLELNSNEDLRMYVFKF